MGAELADYNPQTSSYLLALPPELLEPILADLDGSSLLSLRATCRILSLRVDEDFRALLQSRKYFPHPHSLKLLAELSTSHLAPCVHRIVLGTETFKPTLHLEGGECAYPLAEAFKRLPNLEAVEIRDFSTPYVSDPSRDPWASADGSREADMTLDRPSRFDTINAPYHVRWGHTPDTLRAQGIGRVATEHGILPRDAPRFPPNGPDPNQQLNDLFKATLWACAQAKEESGVDVVDFRVALVNGNWGIRDVDLGRYMAVGKPADILANQRFLASLRVLHLPLLNGRGLRSEAITYLLPFLAACSGLKWLRLEFQETGVGPVCDAVAELCAAESEFKIDWELDRLDLGSMEVPVGLLASLVRKFRPRTFGAWDVILKGGREEQEGQEGVEGQHGGGDNVWAVGLREFVGIVERVRLAHIGQDSDMVWQHVHFPPDRSRMLEVPNEEYEVLSEETVEKVAEAMLFYHFDYGDWEA